jgi:sulfatase maturation enzyme AslB (radical SAM superfamily)
MIVSYQDRRASFDPKTLVFTPIGRTEGSRNPTDISLDPRPSQLHPSRLDPVEPYAKRVVQPWRRGRWLDRLVLNVANYCNLDCVYCYAQGGDYGGPHEKMSLEIGQETFQKFYELYDQISRVMFFGGEPLLNADVIERLCEFGWQTADRLGRQRPVYTMITNGTILSPKIIELVKRYDLKLTISLDGPPRINDKLRPARSGEPTTRQVEENIRILQAETGQPGQIEGTYTRLHIEEGVSVVDVMDYVLRALGIHILHMPINALGRSNRHDPLALRGEDFNTVNAFYAQAVSRSIRDVLTKPVSRLCMLSSVVEIVDTLIHPSAHPVSFICPAGSGTIAVDSDGTVYPCFMFYRNERFRLGSVSQPDTEVLGEASRSSRGLALPLVSQFGPDVLEDAAQESFLARLRPESIPNLARSWAWRFLQGCAGGNHFKNEDHGVIANEEIRLVEAMVSAAVVELAHLKEDEQQWKYLPLAMNLFKLFIDAPME